VPGSRAYDLWRQFKAALWRTVVDDILLFRDVVRFGVRFERLRLGLFVGRADVARMPLHWELGSYDLFGKVSRVANLGRQIEMILHVCNDVVKTLVGRWSLIMCVMNSRAEHALALNAQW
jgi:hypothetical protein